MDTIGKRIKRLREQSDKTQLEISNFLKANGMMTNRVTINKWENDQQIPTIAPVMALAKLFGVTTDYLIDGLDFHRVAYTMQEQEMIDMIRKNPRLLTICDTIRDFDIGEIELANRLLSSIKNGGPRIKEA